MIVTLTSDLLFSSKMSQTAKELGLQITNAKSVEEFKETIFMNSVKVAVVDLNIKSNEPFEAIRFLKEYEQSNFGNEPIRSVGFFAHVDTNLEEKAKREGLKEVMPRSKFTKILPQLFKGE